MKFYPRLPLPTFPVPTSLLRRSSRDYARRRRRPRQHRRAGLRNRRRRRPLGNETATRRRDLLGTTEADRDVDTARYRQRDVDLALADGEFGGAGDVVESVRRHGVVVCVILACAVLVLASIKESGGDVRLHVEQHAVGFAVAKGKTFAVCFAERLAC
jgi:hypothetical protein